MSQNNTEEITTIKLPKLGESITEATILSWMVEEGDVVEEGQVILEVATDKVDSEVPAPASGEIMEISAAEEEVIKVGKVIGKIKASDKKPTSTKKTAAQPKKEKAPNPMPVKKKKKTKPQSKTVGTTQEFVYDNRNDDRFYSPLVHKIAKKHHIGYEELARIPGSGKDGRIRKSDIFNYLNEGRPAQYVQTVQAPQPENTLGGFKMPDLKFDKGTGKIIEMDRMAKMIRDHMIFSRNASPHVTAYVEADMTDMVNWRNANKIPFQEKHGQRLTFTPLFVEAVAKAIQDFPMINSSLDGDNIIQKEDINIGIGAALPDGNLIVPVIKKAGQKNLKELATDVNDLVDKARNNKLSVDETQGGTFTISNVGTFGSTMGTPIINQPQAAILATGVIKKRAEVMEYEDGDEIEIRQMMYLCLSFDHSFIGGHLAGSFLRRIADYFEDYNHKKNI